jgi:hypothetical protein
MLMVEKFVPIRKSSKSSSKTAGVTEPDGAAILKHHRDHDRTNFGPKASASIKQLLEFFDLKGCIVSPSYVTPHEGKLSQSVAIAQNCSGDGT